MSTPDSNKKRKKPPQTWQENFTALVNYKLEHGNTLVPRSYSAEPSLASFVSRTRAGGKDKLSDVQCQQLEDIGFVWEPLKQQWEEMFQRLKHYKEKHGDCLVPVSWKEDPELGGWVKKTRAMKRDGRISKERKERLEGLGFVWQVVTNRKTTNEKAKGKLDKQWEEKYDRLATLKKEGKDCNLPQSYPPDKKLGKWLDDMRVLARAGSLRKDRKKKLEELGINFFVAEKKKHDAWMETLNEVKVYKETYDTIDIPYSGSNSNKKLASWLTTQVLLQKERKLQPERKALLTGLGMEWDDTTEDGETKHPSSSSSTNGGAYKTLEPLAMELSDLLDQSTNEGTSNVFVIQHCKAYLKLLSRNVEKDNGVAGGGRPTSILEENLTLPPTRKAGSIIMPTLVELCHTLDNTGRDTKTKFTQHVKMYLTSVMQDLRNTDTASMQPSQKKPRVDDSACV